MHKRPAQFLPKRLLESADPRPIGLGIAALTCQRMKLYLRLPNRNYGGRQATVQYAPELLDLPVHENGSLSRSACLAIPLPRSQSVG
jgi:hypothetical protein